MKPVFIFIVLTFNFLLFTFPALALNPIIIKRSDPGSPPADTALSDDSIYYPNSVGLVCTGKFTISQTFQPEEKTTTDPNTGEQTTTFVPYDVNRIQGRPPIFNKGFWTNPAALGRDRATNSHPKNFLNTDSINRSFMSYTPDNAEGSIGTGNKNMPEDVLKCLVGQRLVKAVKLANGSGGGVVSNEQVAWYDGGSAKPVTDSDQDDGQKVQLEDIAITMEQNPTLSLVNTDPATGRCLPGTEENLIFYNPDDNCYNNDPTNPSLPVPTPGRLSDFTDPSSDSFQALDPSEACKLYKTLGPEGSGPSMRRVFVYNDDHERDVNPEIKKTNMPRGESLASANSLAIINYDGQDIPPINFCGTYEKNEIRDKPNDLLYAIKQSLEEFGTVFETAMTFSHSLTYEYHIEPAQEANMKIDEVARKNLIPEYVQEADVTLNDPHRPFSSTDSHSFDPGNPYTLNTYARQLQPESMQF
ncbi:hypothetical protein HYV64_03925 [Candidatus Shapirobacteria bacterium]|nr:hypothetical protein [Candidatus Shapirobacteria bacterium]